jgi:hypothetical protein
MPNIHKSSDSTHKRESILKLNKFNGFVNKEIERQEGNKVK